MSMAVALLLLVVGTILFHFLSPWWLHPSHPNWKMMDDTVNITFWVTGIVFVAVNLFMAAAVLLYRHRQGQKAQYSPENKKLEWWLTIVTSLGVAAMLTPGLFVWAKFVTCRKMRRWSRPLDNNGRGVTASLGGRCVRHHRSEAHYT